LEVSGPPVTNVYIWAKKETYIGDCYSLLRKMTENCNNFGEILQNYWEY
jgi:hypothetical protein